MTQNINTDLERVRVKNVTQAPQIAEGAGMYT